MSQFEFDSIITLLDGYFTALQSFTDYMFLSLNDMLANAGIWISLPTWLGGDLSPIVLMLGVSLPLYLIYQFLIWVLNLIT